MLPVSNAVCANTFAELALLNPEFAWSNAACPRTVAELALSKAAFAKLS